MSEVLPFCLTLRDHCDFEGKVKKAEPMRTLLRDTWRFRLDRIGGITGKMRLEEVFRFHLTYHPERMC